MRGGGRGSAVSKGENDLDGEEGAWAADCPLSVVGEVQKRTVEEEADEGESDGVEGGQALGLLLAISPRLWFRSPLIELCGLGDF